MPAKKRGEVLNRQLKTIRVIATEIIKKLLQPSKVIIRLEITKTQTATPKNQNHSLRRRCLRKE